MVRTLTSVATLILILGAAAPAFATHLTGPTPGANDRMWVSVGGGRCHDDFPNSTPTCPNGGTASGFLDPNVQRAHPDNLAFGSSLKGGGSTSANTLKVFVESNDGFSRATAVIEDTYVLSGPAGTVDLGVVFSADGVIEIITARGFNRPVGSGNATIGIGQAMDSSGWGVVNAQSDSFFTGFIDSNNNVPLQYAFDLEVSLTKSVTVGTPFDLAFLFQINGSIGLRGDGLDTALIDFVIPDGYTLTSALGWTSPSEVAVPAPATLWLFLPTLAALAFSARRRTRT